MSSITFGSKSTDKLRGTNNPPFISSKKQRNEPSSAASRFLPYISHITYVLHNIVPIQ